MSGFTIRKEHTFRHKVTVRVPVDGGFSNETFTAVFKVLPKDKAEELLERVKDAPDVGLLREILVGFEDVMDEAGNAIEYSDETRDLLIGIPYVAIPLIKAYHEANLGFRAKN